MSDTIICPECKAPVAVPNLNVSIVNNPDVSFMYVPHLEGVDCSCGAYLKAAIVDLPPGIFNWVPAERPERVIDIPRIQLAH